MNSVRPSNPRPNQFDISLANLIDTSPSPAHLIAYLAQSSSAQGFTKLDSKQTWHLQAGKSYFLEISARSLIAFRMPLKSPRSFTIVGAHTDSPCLRLRERSTHWEDSVLVTGCEVYGGAIHSTWLDRTLRVAGTVALRQGKELGLHPVELSRTQAVIPNLAIHLNRDINKGFEYNPHLHLRALAIIDCPEGQREQPWEYAAAMQLSQDLKRPVAAGEIAGLDLYLADSQAATSLGGEGGLIHAPRLDNLAGCHAAVAALAGAETRADSVQLVCLFDHEEVGSRSASGADSTVLGRCLRRIALAGGLADEQDYLIALEKSIIASVDAAHAQHPNFPDKHDKAYAPRLNAGIALKNNVNQRYATDTLGAARLAQLCAGRGIPLQYFTNRADTACGSTIGPALASMTGISAIDLGIPLLAMHSCRESAGLRDQAWMISALGAFLEEF